MTQSTAASRPGTSSIAPAPIAPPTIPEIVKPAGKPRDRRFAAITDNHVAEAEKSVSNVVKVKRLALRVTNSEDWTDIGGRPYLGNTGCMKVAALFGVSLTGTTVEQFRETLERRHVIRYVARTTARFLGRAIEVEGVSSSDEPFFSRKNGTTLPLSEVDLNAVRKKAVTSAFNRAIKGILGLGNVTWDDVRGAGVGKEAVNSVNYRKPPANGAAPQGSSTGKIRLHNMLHDLATFQEEPFGRIIRHYTTFTGRDGEPRWARSVDAMSEEWVKKTIAEVERDWRAIPRRASRPAAAPSREGQA